MLPRLLMPYSFCLPPVEYCRGTTPTQAAKSRPRRNAVFQVLAGIPGGFKRFRQHGYLIVIALLLVAVWIQSIGYTSGGAEGSTRVLSPALVVLSITGAGLLEPLTRRARWYTAIAMAIIVCQIWTAAQGAIYPND